VLEIFGLFVSSLCRWRLKCYSQQPIREISCVQEGNGKIILKWILMKLVVSMWIETVQDEDCVMSFCIKVLPNLVTHHTMKTYGEVKL
jgi:hypothetical protein